MSGRSKKYENDEAEEKEIAEEIKEETGSVSEDTEVFEKEKDSESESPGKDNADVELTERISELEKEAFDYRDKLIRKAAEFENYRKRTSEEYVRLINTANEDLIIKLLPVLDDIERFGKNYSESVNPSDLKKGVDMIFSKLDATLKGAGLTEIEAVNADFDPELHDAMMTVEKEGTTPNKIVDQYEKGYKLNDKVIRHSKVIVSK